MLAGCDAFDADLLDAGSHRDASPDSFRPDISGLEPGRIPERPAIADGPDVATATFLLRDIALNQDGERWRNIGVNLDGLVTARPDDAGECRPPTEDADAPIDGERGIDNVFGDVIFPLLALSIPDLEARVRASGVAGRGTLVVRIAAWNGARDDPHVSAWITQSAAITAADFDSVHFEGFDLVDAAGNLAEGPAWDGDDFVYGRTDTFIGGDENAPVWLDDNAYVADGALIMRPSELSRLRLFAGLDKGLPLTLSDAYFIASIVDAPSDTGATAWVAGRWSVAHVLAANDNLGICVGTANRDILSNQLDIAADVRTMPGLGGPDVECDAVSVGLRFSVRPAQWGGVGPARPLPNPCANPPVDG